MAAHGSGQGPGPGAGSHGLIPHMPLFNPAQSSVDAVLLEEALAKGGREVPNEDTTDVDDVAWWMLGCQVALDMRAKEEPCVRATRIVDATGEEEVLVVNQAWLHAYLRAWHARNPWRLEVVVGGSPARGVASQNFVDFMKDYVRGHPADSDDLAAAETALHVKLWTAPPPPVPRGHAGSAAPLRMLYSVVRWRALVAAWELEQDSGAAARVAEATALADVLHSPDYEGDSVTVEVSRPSPTSVFGFTFEMMTLVDVKPGSAAAARGLIRYIGRKLYRVDRTPMTNVAEVNAYCAGKTKVTLHLARSDGAPKQLVCGGCTVLAEKIETLEKRLRASTRPTRAWDPDARVTCAACRHPNIMPWAEVCPSCRTPLPPPASQVPPPSPPPPPVPPAVWGELTCPSCHVLFAVPRTRHDTATCPWCACTFETPMTGGVDAAPPVPKGAAVLCRVCSIPVHDAACPLCGLHAAASALARQAKSERRRQR